MKKFLYCVAAMASMLFAASCQQEKLETFGEGHVTFTVTAPGELDTRAIADGKNVNEVHYAVYKTDSGVPHSLYTPDEKPLAQGFVTMLDKKATLELDLLQDQNYTILFWAQVKPESGKEHYILGDLREVKIKYTEVTDPETGKTYCTVKANDESRAAFFRRYDFNTTKQSYEVMLYRPFAQINLGTTPASLTPKQEGEQTGYKIDVLESEMEVEGIASSFDLIKGEGKNEAVNYRFTSATTPAKASEKLSVNDIDYHYVGMNYLLVPILDKNVTVSYKITTDKGVVDNSIKNVPVKENYRTNIIGNLLTSKTDFEIIVDEKFEVPEHVIGDSWTQTGNYQYTVNAGASQSSLAEILAHADKAAKEAAKNAATKAEGPTVTITLNGDVEWETGAAIGSTPLLPEDSPISAVVINGNGRTFTATGKGVGKIRLANGGKLTFNNVKIVDESVSYAENSWEYGYLEFGGVIRLENCEVVNAIMISCETAAFKNCSFNSHDDNQYAVWVDNGSAFFTGCSFTGARGLKTHEAYGSEVVKVSVDGCTFGPLSKKPGLAIGTVNEDTTISIKNSLFNKCQAGDQGLYIYESDTDVTTFAFTLDNNVVIPDGDDPVEQEDGTIIVATSKALRTAIAEYSDVTIRLADGVYEGLFYVNGKSLDIEAFTEGKATINGKLGIAASGKTVNVKGIVFENSYEGSVAAGHQYLDKTGSYCIGLYCASVNVENCTFNLSENGGINFYAINDPEYCTVKNSTFNCNGFRPILSKVNVTVDGCTFNDQYKYSLQVWGNKNNGEKVIFTNNTINEAGKTSGCADAYKSYVSVSKSYPLKNVAFTISGNTEGYNFVYDNNANVEITTCTLNGKQIVAGQCYTPAGVDDVKEVILDYTGGTYAGPADIQAVIDAAAEGTEITLTVGDYETAILAKSNITLAGTEGAVVDCINLNGAENVTLKNITFDAAGAQVAYDGKGGGKQYANIMGASSKGPKGARNVRIEGCTFAGTFADGGVAMAFVDQGRGSGQSGNITVTDCTFATENGYYDIYMHYSGYGEFNIVDNTFSSSVLGLPVYLGRYQSSTAVVVSGNDFEKCADLENAVYVQDHSNYGVSVDASNNTFAE